MSNIPTPHIGAKSKDIISQSVLMPGDPLRAKFIAENYLTEAVLFNSVRNMFGYTGNYKGKKVSVMGSGMGMASIGIYSFELYSFYGVENIIRIGSAGSYCRDCNIYDLILVDSAWSESTFAKVLAGYKEDIMFPSEILNDKIKNTAETLNVKIKDGRIHSTDVFYRNNFDKFKTIRDKYGCIAAEMESFALFANARSLNKNASCLLTITDSLVTNEKISAEEREKSLSNMIRLALESV